VGGFGAEKIQFPQVIGRASASGVSCIGLLRDDVACVIHTVTGGGTGPRRTRARSMCGFGTKLAARGRNWGAADDRRFAPMAQILIRPSLAYQQGPISRRMDLGDAAGRLISLCSRNRATAGLWLLLINWLCSRPKWRVGSIDEGGRQSKNSERQQTRAVKETHRLQSDFALTAPPGC